MQMMKLRNFSTSPKKSSSKEQCNKKMQLLQKRLFELQNFFYADGRFSLLLIFQGIDTAGKDGTIRHVMSCMNPMGVEVKSFKKPTAEELRHDFLWRIYSHFPASGIITVFNRSYYEDILVPSIEKKMSEEEFRHRCQLITSIEKHLVLNKTFVMKFFLHISNEEQEKRITDRLTDPAKRWKYSAEDQAAADKWPKYMEVYDRLLNTCKSPAWHIIPANKRWYRNYAVAKILVNQLETFPLKYPELNLK